MKYGPENPHPLSKLKAELVWEGKYDEFGNRREVALPNFPLVMQRIETIDEPRDRSTAQGSLFDEDTAHRDDFRNRLIWGDNKLAIAALLPEFRSKVKCIYIDPPFDIGADFSANLTIGGDLTSVRKEQSVLETVAYRDLWGKGRDSYLEQLYETLQLLHGLLSDDGSIYVHLDYHVGHYVKVMMDSVFGADSFVNEIIWKRSLPHNDPKRYGSTHDTILFYSKSADYEFNQQHTGLSEEYIASHYNLVDKDGRKYQLTSLAATGTGPARKFGDKILDPPKGNHWRYSQENIDDLIAKGRIVFTRNGTPRYVRYMDEMKGPALQSIWTDINPVNSQADERIEYPTQKPEALLERIIKASSSEGDLVADFFCGSGTTLATAEKLGRRWIGADLGRYAIHTTRKRLIGVQRDLFAEEKAYRSFDLFNLGRYERQWWQLDRLKGANEEHRATVLKFFRAQILASSPSPLLHGTKGGSFVHVDDIDSLLTLEELEAVAKATSDAGGRALTCLAWEFQMDLKMKAQALEAKYKINIGLKYIPREIMEPNRTEVQFFEAAALSAEAVKLGQGKETLIDVRLTSFIPSLSEVPEKELETLRERAITSPFDFIDFWAIDFEHGEDKPFEHHWQDFRTRKERSLLTQSNCQWKYKTPGKKQIRIKVIDVFGIDTTKVIEVTV